jgi:hypothetical protein
VIEEADLAVVDPGGSALSNANSPEEWERITGSPPEDR